MFFVDTLGFFPGRGCHHAVVTRSSPRVRHHDERRGHSQHAPCDPTRTTTSLNRRQCRPRARPILDNSTVDSSCFEDAARRSPEGSEDPATGRAQRGHVVNTREKTREAPVTRGARRARDSTAGPRDSTDGTAPIWHSTDISGRPKVLHHRPLPQGPSPAGPSRRAFPQGLPPEPLESLLPRACSCATARCTRQGPLRCCHGPTRGVARR